MYVHHIGKKRQNNQVAKLQKNCVKVPRKRCDNENTRTFFSVLLLILILLYT